MKFNEIHCLDVQNSLNLMQWFTNHQFCLQEFFRLSDPRGYYQARGEHYAAFGGCRYVHM